MTIKTDNNFIFDVTFLIEDREPGFEDDVRFRMSETGPETTRILRGNPCSVLLTAYQAERLARALLEVAGMSRETTAFKR